MFTFQPFSEIDWMSFAGAESFADGRDPMISVGDVTIDDAPAEIVINGRGLQIFGAPHVISPFEIVIAAIG